MDQKMKEMDQLYKDNETLRNELGTYRTSLDMEAIDRKVQRFIDKDEISTRIIKSYLELESFLDNAFLCTMCQDLVSKCVLIAPCCHIFCSAC